MECVHDYPYFFRLALTKKMSSEGFEPPIIPIFAIQRDGPNGTSYQARLRALYSQFTKFNQQNHDQNRISDYTY